MTTERTALSDRELDESLAEKLFKWVRQEGALEHWYRTPSGPLVSPIDFALRVGWSSTWEGCGAVLEAMRERGWYGEMEVGATEQFAYFEGSSFPRVSATASTLPRAVCEAALAALSVEE